MFAAFPYSRLCSSYSQVLLLVLLGPCTVKHPFCRSLYHRILIACCLGFFFYFCRRCVVRASLHVVPSSLIFLLSSLVSHVPAALAVVFSPMRSGCVVVGVICTVPVPLCARLLLAFEGLGPTQIGRSTGSCARSVRSWALTQVLLLGARVEIM